MGATCADSVHGAQVSALALCEARGLCALWIGRRRLLILDVTTNEESGAADDAMDADGGAQPDSPSNG